MQLQRGPNRGFFAQLKIHHRMTVAECNPLPEANGDAALATGSNFPGLPVAPLRKWADQKQMFLKRQ
jgi:hypothetical protein